MKKAWNRGSRGRGAGWNSYTGTNTGAQSYARKPNAKQRGNFRKSTAEETFKKASAKHERDAKEALQSFEDYYESSSDEDNLDDDKILSNLIKSYKGPNLQSGDSENVTARNGSLGNTAQYLIESCQSGALTCLVCISSVKRQNQVWSCKKCYAIFHLQCIKQWVLEGIAQATLLSEEYFPNRDQPWFCPKCRMKYSRSDCPDTYFCFCGTVQDPPLDPWLLPHSCGGICNKPLQNPTCGHSCLLLCHPGPCPPCPQTVELGCFCGKHAAVSRRCGSGKWSCGQVCTKLLSCKRHRCQIQCHDQECSPCEQSSVQRCNCGLQKRTQPCTQPSWSCEKVCDKLLSCGKHRCQKICHKPGECGECPRAGVRTCPCGKKKYDDLPCTEEVEMCEDTCNKVLGCYGDHTCARRCHFGPCGLCPLIVMKPCRCGERQRELPCHKEFLCEKRCSKFRSCGKHQCKHKCCVGNCPPCEQICGKVLQCKKHKCQMFCHKGPCYPCPLTSKVYCNCGGTAITVVCGKEHSTKPPRCRLPCTAPSICHHPARLPHNCHFGKCPTCKQICSKTLSCGHICPAACHDNVLIKNQVKPTAPWEAPQQTWTLKTLPCPPCKVPIHVLCRGQHETGQFVCSEANEYNCGMECGRELSCGNHKCTLLCHTVEDSSNLIKAGSTCELCERQCDKPRVIGCKHECVSLCHPGECPPCRKQLKMKCHCGMVALRYLCTDWTSKSDEERDRMISCGNYCPKMLIPCGHMCPLTCHAGVCPSSEQCSKKVTLRCPCKRKKKEFICSVVHKEGIKIACDDVCKEIKAAKEAEKAEVERHTREAEEKKQLEEVERFERKMNRKSRNRKRVSSEEKDRSVGLWKRFVSSRAYSLVYYVGLVAVVLAAFLYAIHLTKIDS